MKGKDKADSDKWRSMGVQKAEGVEWKKTAWEACEAMGFTTQDRYGKGGDHSGERERLAAKRIRSMRADDFEFKRFEDAMVAMATKMTNAERGLETAWGVLHYAAC